MQAIRGRYGYFKLMQTDQLLSTHLMKTTVFSKTNFYESLSEQNLLFIKPLLGAQEILIIVVENSFELTINNKTQQFTSKEELYELLREKHLLKKYYVIQVLPSVNSAPHRILYTIHRKSPSANWKVQQRTLKNMTHTNRFKDLFHIWRLNQFLIEAATKLGNAFPNCHTVVLDIANVNTSFVLVDATLHERNSKWSQYNTVIRKRAVRYCIPPTDICTTSTLSSYLKKYRQVILKPCVGQQGRGLVKIEIGGNRYFEVHERKTITIIDDFHELTQYIQDKYLSERDYIVQKYIALTTVDHCPYDIRVITQMDKSEWVVTGTMAKIAAKDYFITNRAQKLLSAEDAIVNSDDNLSGNAKIKAIEKLCIKCSKILLNNVGGLEIIGFDIGIDKYGQIWMIEANYTPSLSMFYGFENNDIHKRINHYIKLNKN